MRNEELGILEYLGKIDMSVWTFDRLLLYPVYDGYAIGEEMLSDSLQ